MKHIYIIVHEEEVRVEHDAGVTLSVRAYREIQEIKRDYVYRNLDGDPSIILEGLPPPAECRIHVCGSSLANCVPRQIEALREANHEATVSRSASIY